MQLTNRLFLPESVFSECCQSLAQRYQRRAARVGISALGKGLLVLRQSSPVFRSNNPSPTAGLPQAPQGFISKRKRHVSKDRVLLKRLEQLVAAGQLDGQFRKARPALRANVSRQSDEAGNDALRHHFHQLTEKMLAPLNRFVSSLIPPK
jgi:hypothetical protein